jgi:hypothetical protein
LFPLCGRLVVLTAVGPPNQPPTNTSPPGVVATQPNPSPAVEPKPLDHTSPPPGVSLKARASTPPLDVTDGSPPNAMVPLYQPTTYAEPEASAATPVAELDSRPTP